MIGDPLVNPCGERAHQRPGEHESRPGPRPAGRAQRRGHRAVTAGRSPCHRHPLDRLAAVLFGHSERGQVRFLPGEVAHLTRQHAMREHDAPSAETAVAVEDHRGMGCHPGSMARSGGERRSVRL